LHLEDLGLQLLRFNDLDSQPMLSNSPLVSLISFAVESLSGKVRPYTMKHFAPALFVVLFVPVASFSQVKSNDLINPR